jgi:integrase
VSEQSKRPTEKGLRNRGGKWEYRFKLHGKPYSRITDLEAEERNVLAAQAQKMAHMEELRKGKRVFARPISAPLDQAVPRFLAWYRGEHENRKCKWAASLMASFQFYFEQARIPLVRINAGDLENFKQWRRDDQIHDNTLRKQLLLLRQFFRYARKQGWTKAHPFAKDDDDNVRIPSEKESDAMHVLSVAEERRYIDAARALCADLADVATIMVEQGPRPEEVMSLRQSDVDLFSRRFTIQRGKTDNARRTLRMTDATFRIFSQRLAKLGLWVFPSSKKPKKPSDPPGRRTTLQKSHEQITRGRKDGEGKRDGGIGLACRLYDMRHTFATRFAVGGGALPILAKILGHADLSLLMRYVHPAQADMDRAMQWYDAKRVGTPELDAMLVGDGVDRPPFCPPSHEKEVKSGSISLKWERKGA